MAYEGNWREKKGSCIANKRVANVLVGGLERWMGRRRIVSRPCLREVEAAIEEGAQSELARPRQHRACLQACAHHPPRAHAAAMAVQLDDVLGGVGARRQHDQSQHLA